MSSLRRARRDRCFRRRGRVASAREGTVSNRHTDLQNRLLPPLQDFTRKRRSFHFVVITSSHSTVALQFFIFVVRNIEVEQFSAVLLKEFVEFGILLCELFQLELMCDGFILEVIYGGKGSVVVPGIFFRAFFTLLFIFVLRINV